MSAFARIRNVSVSLNGTPPLLSMPGGALRPKGTAESGSQKTLSNELQSYPAGMTTAPPSTKRLSATPFGRSEEHTSELQSLMRNSYAVFCLKKKQISTTVTHTDHI